MRAHVKTLLLAIWISGFLVTGQDTGRPQLASSAITVGPDDTLTIVALNVEEISKEWRVGTTGDLSLPMVGVLQASGKTVEQLEQEIAEKLKVFVIEPQVTVYVSELRSRPVIVSGAVANPGIVQLRGNGTVFSALMLAGGPKASAAKVILTRSLDQGRINFKGAQENGPFSVLEIPMKDIGDGYSPAANVALMPKDIISVVADEEKKLVHIVGDVVKPGSVELISMPKISLTQVLLLAGGLTRTASPQDTRIYRIGPEGIGTKFSKVKMKDILDGKSDDIQLSPGDIVQVPSSNLKIYLQLAPQAALASGLVLLGRF